MTALARRLSPAAAIPTPPPVGVVLGVPFALLGAAAVVYPFYTLAAALGLIFILIAFRNLAAGVALFAVTTFFVHLPGTGSGSGVGVTVVKLAGVVLVAAWLLLLFRRKVPLLLVDHPFVASALIVFPVWAFSSALWAQDAGVAVSSSLRYGQNVLLVFIVYSALRKPRDVRWLVWAFIAGALISLILAFAGGPTASATGSGSYRLGGRFGAGDPNYFAALLLPAIVFAAFLLVAERDRATRIVLVGLAFLFTIGLLQTESRGGIVALAATGVASLFLTGRIRGRAMIATALVALVGVTYFGAVASPASRARVTHLNSQDSSGRNDLWRIGLAMAGDHPVLGVGSGNFTVVSPRYAERAFDIVNIDYVVDTPKVTHNTYLNVLDELGIPGLVIFAAIVAGAFATAFAAIRALVRSGDVGMEMVARALVLGSVGMLVASFSFSGMYQKQLWLFIGAALALSSVARFSLQSSEPTEGHAASPAAPHASS
ncbi:MAG: O-antigen ligase family protein [Actinomycetota bacterium]|nr:O-antigen ligase family protein [Actinomycetota bacterium]